MNSWQHKRASDCRLQAVDCQNPAWCENHSFTSGSQIFQKWGCTLCLGCILEFSPRNNHSAQTAAALSWRASFLVGASSSRSPLRHPSGDRWAAPGCDVSSTNALGLSGESAREWGGARSCVGGMVPACQCQPRRGTPPAVCAPTPDDTLRTLLFDFWVLAQDIHCLELFTGKFLADNIVGSVLVFSLIFWIPFSILVHCVVSHQFLSNQNILLNLSTSNHRAVLKSKIYSEKTLTCF